MDFSNFKWLNESIVEIDKNTVTIFTPGGTDYFNNPVLENGVLPEPQGNAPFFYQEVKGDFVFRAKVKPTHKTLYDAAGLMVFHDSTVWLKAAYEMTGVGKCQLLTVATNQLSDDAPGRVLDISEVWLQIARKGNNLAIHYSLDGVAYELLRVIALPLEDTVKVGLEAQSSMGEGINQAFMDVALEMVSIENVWAGK